MVYNFNKTALVIISNVNVFYHIIYVSILYSIFVNHLFYRKTIFRHNQVMAIF